MGLRVERTVRDLRVRDARGREKVIPVVSIAQGPNGWAPAGEGWIVIEARLSCLHWHVLRKPHRLGREGWRPILKTPKHLRTYRCPPCGMYLGGQRRVNGRTLEERERDERKMVQHLKEAIPEAVQDRPRLEAMVLFVEAALEARTIQPLNAQAEGVYQRIDRQAQLAGLLPGDELPTYEGDPRRHA